MKTLQDFMVAFNEMLQWAGIVYCIWALWQLGEAIKEILKVLTKLNERK